MATQEMASSSLETVGLQLAMAFGQGAGVMLATEAALREAFNAYRSNVEARLTSWHDFSLQTIEFSRALGSLAAFHALAAGRTVIDVEDVHYGLDRVRRSTLLPLATCRITEAD